MSNPIQNWSFFAEEVFMLPFYENFKEDLEIYEKKSRHVRPHLHKSMECIYITEGTLEIGVGQELYHMNTNDFAVVFPDLIHHYQVFDSGNCRAIYLMSSPSLSGGYLQLLQRLCPKTPVLSASKVHPDIPYALHSLLHLTSYDSNTRVLWQAYTQIILARISPCLEFIDKSSISGNDIIYRTVAYMAAHFTEDVSLTQMAEALGYSPYALSRVFSNTFHCNFNTYLNNLRLDYACSLLEYTDRSVTEISYCSGFGSQRTFNRVFQDRYKMSPRDYRKKSAEL